MNWQYWLQRVAYNLGLGGSVRYVLTGIGSIVALIIVLLVSIS